MSHYIATQHFRLRGISVAVGQRLPTDWASNLLQRIVAKKLARPMTRAEIEIAFTPTNAAPMVEVAGQLHPHVLIAPDTAPIPDYAVAPGVAVVTLSCYPDIFAKLRDTMNYWEPNVRKILVTSGAAKFEAPGWEVVKGVEPFCFGRNANVGLRLAGVNDALLVNDDVRIAGPVTRAIRETAYRHKQVGVLAPQVNGGCGNVTQRKGTRIDGDVAFPTVRLAFIAIYLKHATVARIGLFDEQFMGYGSEDTDYCFRVERAGLKCGITPNATVIHGHGVNQSSSSFRRKMGPKEQANSMMEMRKQLAQKWQRCQL